LSIILLSLLSVFLALRIKNLKKEYLYVRYFHPLTGLPNKNSLYKDALKNESSGSSGMAVLYIDIDNFRLINDIAGHDLGDMALQKVGTRLAELCKNKGNLYHVGEDEFVILYPDVSEKGIGEIMAAYILGGFKTSMQVLDHDLFISISIGVFEQNKQNFSIQQLLSFAEAAMYQAKSQGKKQYVLFNKNLGHELVEKANISKLIHKAYENNEFEVYYQPQLDLAFDRIDGFEALLRWKSPILGMVPPNQFIQVAEETQLIIPLGAWVLRSACAFLKKLEAAGYAPLSISVNVSVIQLLQDDFVPLVQETLEFLEIKPVYLELEITESILMKFELVKPKLEQLRKIGVRIALDDFGTGYSSLGYLSQTPITTLKLDKSFTDRIGSSYEILIDSVIYLCKKMELQVVAEGVETNSQLDYLRTLGCHRMQGYLYSKPLPEKEVMDLLKSTFTLFDDSYTV
jgi:diguanylate cyclase (GGDEF)-like protein